MLEEVRRQKPEARINSQLSTLNSPLSTLNSQLSTLMPHPFIYHRIVRFQETDGAGVVFFANVLSLCHEAYEAALMAGGIDLKGFFNHPEMAVPIVHATVDFRQPLRVGDELAIHLAPQILKESEFEISYQILTAATDRILCTALTRHVCIDPLNRTRKALPLELLAGLRVELPPQNLLGR